MPRGSGGNVAGFKLLSTPNAPTIDGVSTSIGSASVSFTAPSDTGDAAISSYVVTAVNESTGVSTAASGTESPISISPGGGTFKIRMQALNAYGPGRLTEYDTGNSIFSGAELYAWGANYHGQVGDGTNVYRSSPVQVGALTTWSEVAAAGNFSLGVKTDGTLWSWGIGSYGTLGHNNTISRSSPVQVGALTTWYKVAVGTQHSAAIKTDGTLWEWGENGYGQLGDGTTVDKSSPIQVGALTDWHQVAAGRHHTVAVKTDNTLWGWGYNQAGCIGDNTIINRSSPVQVGALTNWSQVSAGFIFTIAVKTDGTLWSWGNGGSGRLGTNESTFTDRSSPIQVGSLSNWSKVACGEEFTVAIKTDGTLWSWASNNVGQLGDNTTANRSSPVQIGALTTWYDVGANVPGSSVSAIKTDGTLWMWGRNLNGTLGDNTTVTKSSPIQVGALTNWYQVETSGYLTVGVLGVTS